MITKTQKEHLNRFTDKQKAELKKGIEESYKVFLKEQEGYKSQGFKLPQGLNSKKVIPYTFITSKEKANKEHKIMYGLNILHLTMECKNNYKLINKQIELICYLFKDDLEVLKIIQEVKEVLKC